MRTPLVFATFAILLCGCGPAPVTSPGRFGEITTAIVIVSPVINSVLIDNRDPVRLTPGDELRQNRDSKVS